MGMPPKRPIPIIPPEVAEAAAPKRQLTPDDPVDPATIERLHQLQDTRLRLGDNLLSLEMTRVQLLASTKRVDDQRTRIFEGIMLDRGLPPDTVVDIDARTGKIKIDASSSGNAEEEVPSNADKQPGS